MKKGLFVFLVIAAFFSFSAPARSDNLLYFETVVNGELTTVSYGFLQGANFTITGLATSDKQTLLTCESGEFKRLPFENEYKVMVIDSMIPGDMEEAVLVIAFCQQKFEEFRDLDGNLQFPNGLKDCHQFFITQKRFDRIREKLNFPVVPMNDSLSESFKQAEIKNR